MIQLSWYNDHPVKWKACAAHYNYFKLSGPFLSLIYASGDVAGREAGSHHICMYVWSRSWKEQHLINLIALQMTHKMKSTWTERNTFKNREKEVICRIQDFNLKIERKSCGPQSFYKSFYGQILITSCMHARKEADSEREKYVCIVHRPAREHSVIRLTNCPSTHTACCYTYTRDNKLFKCSL